MPNLDWRLASLGAAFFLLLSVALALVGLGMVWCGYCPSRHGFISESDARDAAATYAMGITQVYLSKDSRFMVPDRPLPYTSLAEFMRENPDCCTPIDTAMSAAEIFEKITGRNFAHFDVRHKVRFLDESGSVQTNEQTVSVRVTNCAEAYSAL